MIRGVSRSEYLLESTENQMKQLIIKAKLEIETFHGAIEMRKYGNNKKIRIRNIIV